MDCSNIKLTPELAREALRYNSAEELLRAGGFSIEAMDRAAFGFTDSDIETLMPKQLHIKWKDDWDGVKWEVQRSGLPPKAWAKKVSLEEPIDVSYEKNKFWVEDGHHRVFAAKALGLPLKVNLEIKQTPILVLAPDLSYDDFHRCAYAKAKKEQLYEIRQFVRNILSLI